MVEQPPTRAPEGAEPRAWPVPWQPVWGEADGPGSRLGTWAARGALALAARLPELALGALLASLARLGAGLDRRRARAAEEFLRQAFGDLPEEDLRRLTRSAWVQLLQVSVDMERLRRVPRERLEEHFEVRTSDDARRALDDTRGCLLLSGHLGNWEVAFTFLPALGWHPVYGVAKPPKNKFLSQALQRSRESWGVRVLSRKGAMADAPTILKAGGRIAMVIDQRTSGRALLAPFFGRLARCERAPAVLLKRQKVPIVLASCLLTSPMHYRIEFHEVLWPEEWARREVEAIVSRVNQGLERLIRAHPEQYVWIHDRYRDTPRELAEGARPRLERGGGAARRE